MNRSSSNDKQSENSDDDDDDNNINSDHHIRVRGLFEYLYDAPTERKRRFRRRGGFGKSRGKSMSRVAE